MRIWGSRRRRHSLKINKSGLSLLEITISVAIMGIIALGFSSMISQQVQQQKRLELKMSQIEVKGLITSAFKNPTTCLNQLSGTSLGTIKNGSSAVMNLSAVTGVANTSPTAVARIDLTKILLGDTINAPVAVTAGEPLPGLKFAKISSIYLGEIRYKGTTGTTDTYNSNLVINLDSKSVGLGVVKPITISVDFSTSSTAPANSRTMTSCVASEGGGSGGSGSVTVSNSPCPSGSTELMAFFPTIGCKNALNQQVCSTTAAWVVSGAPTPLCTYTTSSGSGCMYPPCGGGTIQNCSQPATAKTKYLCSTN